MWFRVSFIRPEEYVTCQTQVYMAGKMSRLGEEKSFSSHQVIIFTKHLSNEITRHLGGPMGPQPLLIVWNVFFYLFPPKYIPRNSISGNHASKAPLVSFCIDSSDIHLTLNFLCPHCLSQINSCFLPCFMMFCRHALTCHLHA